MFWVSSHDLCGRSVLITAISSPTRNTGNIGNRIQTERVGSFQTWNRLGTRLGTPGRLTQTKQHLIALGGWSSFRRQQKCKEQRTVPSPHVSMHDTDAGGGSLVQFVAVCVGARRAAAGQRGSRGAVITPRAKVNLDAGNEGKDRETHLRNDSDWEQAGRDFRDSGAGFGVVRGLKHAFVALASVKKK